MRPWLTQKKICLNREIYIRIDKIEAVLHGAVDEFVRKE